MNRTPEDFLRLLDDFVKYQKLSAFYSPGSQVIRDLARKAPGIVGSLKQRLKSQELADQVFYLSLYNLVILLDDSGSMQWNNYRSIETLRTFLNLVIETSTIYLPSGAHVCWINDQSAYRSVKTASQIKELIHICPFEGWTKIGEALHHKVVEPLILDPARRGVLEKPWIVMVITDGEPAGEPKDTLRKAILYAQQSLNKTRYGETAVEYQFAHVGNNAEAINFLRELDTDPEIGKLIDCTSEEGIETAEVLQKSGTELTPEMWVAKLMLGPVEKYFDAYDEE